MKFNEYESLDEAFDRASKIDKRVGARSWFKVNGAQYMAQYMINSRQEMSISFSYFDEEDGHSFALTHGDPREAMQVLATVITEAKYRLEKNPQVQHITFEAYRDSSDQDYNKRVNLYRKMAERFAKELGWELSQVRGDFTLSKPRVFTQPQGYESAWGQEILDIYEMNTAAIVKVIDKDDVFVRLNNGATLTVANGQEVILSTGPINMVDSWWDAFYDLEWYNDEEGEMFYDTEQKIAKIAGKVWVINDRDITIWKSVDHLERDSDGLEISQVTQMSIE